MTVQTHEALDRTLLKFGLRRTTKLAGIGKSIGGNIYLHRQYEWSLPWTSLARAKMYLSPDFAYDIIKYNTKTGHLSFVECSDFDILDEPSLGFVCLVRPELDNKVKIIKPCGFIYHHKWQFVTNNYKGFDVIKSKLRSIAWVGLAGVDKSRIGQKEYWETNVVPRIREVDE